MLVTETIGRPPLNADQFKMVATEAARQIDDLQLESGVSCDAMVKRARDAWTHVWSEVMNAPESIELTWSAAALGDFDSRAVLALAYADSVVKLGAQQIYAGDTLRRHLDSFGAWRDALLTRASESAAQGVRPVL